MNEYKVVEYFECLVAEYSNSKYAVAVDSCTSAIFLSLMFRGIHGKEITLPSETYISVPCSVIHAGGIPKFKNYSWKGIYTIEPVSIVDSALRFTSNMYIKNTLYCLSFHVKKHLNLGKGGMILTDNKEAAKWLKLARYNGREGKDYLKERFRLIGWNMYMTPEDATRGVRIFKTLPTNNLDKVNEYQNLEKYKFDNVVSGNKLHKK
jgi:dTDP-4-amino-4,6-dideoxygalactose transaminase